MERIKGYPREKKTGFSYVGLWTVIFAAVFSLFLSFPSSIRRGVERGLSLCLETVIPALFPFSVLSAFFMKMGLFKGIARPFSGISKAAFGMRGEAFALWLTGMMTGFPIGGRMAAELYAENTLTKSEAEKIVAFSNCPSPAFVISFFGGMFSSPGTGVLMFCLLCLSSFLCGCAVGRLFPDVGEPETAHALKKSLGSPISAFTAACVSGWDSINTVCSFVIFFSSLSALLSSLFGQAFLRGVTAPVLNGMLELTSGISFLDSVGLSPYWQFVVGAFLLSFSGLCANMQVICFLKATGLDIGPYLLGRCVITVLCTGGSFAVGLLI